MSDYGRAVISAALWQHLLVEAGCSCGLVLDVRTDEWSHHAAQAVVDVLRDDELRVVSATDTAAEVADEVRLIRDHHGDADDCRVGGSIPLLKISDQSTGAARIRVPLLPTYLAEAAARVVAHEEACAATDLGDGPTLHDLLLADVTAALAAADDPDRWRQAMVRVAATAVWCAERSPR